MSTKRKIYKTYAEARIAARALNFKNSVDYTKNYHRDPQLIATPSAYYKDFVSFSDYLGCPEDLRGNHYSYAEAADISRKAGIKNKKEYLVFHKTDHRLPSKPNLTYCEVWVDWNEFCNHHPKYNNFEEARNVARSLKFHTQSHYIRSCLKIDSRLRTAPDRAFKEWHGWEDYLGINVEAEFFRYEEAKELMQAKNIQSNSQYLKYREDEPRLPRMPQITWKEEWVDWTTFLGQRADPYSEYEHAKQAVIELDITSEAQYRQYYMQDPLLPKHPYRFYAEWKGWEDYLAPGERYATIGDARSAAIRLGMLEQAHYEAGYSADPKLPKRPDITYKRDWKGWNAFYGTLPVPAYADFEQARSAAQSLGFGSKTDYVKNCKNLDSRLRIDPKKHYNAWAGWDDYLGAEKNPRFLSYEEAVSRVRLNNISTHAQYLKFRRKALELPYAPSKVYREQWIDWPTFLGHRAEPYITYQQAKEAAYNLDITTSEEYRSHYVDDLNLPKHPYQVYEPDWKSWEEFLPIRDKYDSVDDASAKACALGFKTRQDYEEGYEADPFLPKRPDLFYQGTWPASGWTGFLTAVLLYPTAVEASAAARSLGLITRADYTNLRHLDPRLPASPRQHYESYNSWTQFILPEKCTSLIDVKFAIKVIGIKDSRAYRENYKHYSCLPAHPDRVFADEWIDWYDTCNIIRPLCYEDVTALLRKLNLPTSSAYKKYVKQSGNNQFPLTPDKVYADEWVNWQVFLGKAEPYTLVTLREPYDKWRFAIADFMRTVKGSFKVHHLVMFVRDYVKPNDFGEDPIVFFTARDFDSEDYKAFLHTMSAKKRIQHLAALKEFTEHFLEKNLSARCEDTGENILVAGARNPFTKLSLPSVGNTAPGQTTKPPLAYHHVVALREWMIPPAAASFSDLKHLHGFDNDWFPVDKSLIDKDDPDCVFIEEKGRYLIWFPGFWMHTYALSSVPLRGVQLAYADSGECDRLIPVMVQGKPQWIDNPSQLRGQTDSQGFIKRYPENDEFGMHLTTNKTAHGMTGYDVPWMPEDLAKWMIRLRDWQSKYNPVSRPMPWSECTNTNYSEPERISKGSNCFLFRDFGFEECGASFGSRLYRRIAISLYNTSPELTTFKGTIENVTDYSSEYTPHTMRVSLITAYVMEFRLPLNIIVKIVGHASIIMTIYYVKTNGELLRQQFTEAEKRYLHKQSKGAYQALLENRDDRIKHSLLTNNEQAINLLVGELAAGSALYRDYGICLTAASRCADGALVNGKFVAVPSGYLGRENCLHCRHFVTGPVFLGGLLSLANEISLCCRVQLEKLDTIQNQQTELRLQIKKLTMDRYDAAEEGEAGGVDYKSLINERQYELTSLNGLISSASVKADMYLADLNVINRLSKQCRALIENQANGDEVSSSTQLIVTSGHESVITFEEVSLFRQLNEVCENADIYTSANADLAAPERGNMIDRMAELNRLAPAMYKLDKKSQVTIGNQLVKFMLARMKTWETVDAVMTGTLSMEDLPEDQRLTPGAFQSLLGGTTAQDVLRLEYQPPSDSPIQAKLLFSQDPDYIEASSEEMA